MNHDEKLKAFLGAYVWIAYSDGDFSLAEKVEIEKIAHKLNLPFSVKNEVVRDIYLDFAQSFKHDYESGKERVQEILKNFRHDQGTGAQILQLAQHAIIADRKLKPQEEAVIAEISNILNVSE